MRTITLLLTVIGLGSSLIGTAQTAADSFCYEFGHFIVNTLNETEGNGSESLLIGLTPQMKDKFLPDGTYPNAVNAYLIRIREHNILADAGFGIKLYENLAVQGVEPAAVDIILMTHLHGDHIGGLVREDTAAFPNARLFISRPEYEYWTSEAIYAATKENGRRNFDKVRTLVDLYKERIVLFTPAEMGRLTTPLIPGIYAMAAYGHTPGHTAFVLESDNRKCIIWGDLTHAMAIQMPHPEVAAQYDLDPALAVESRLATLKYAAKEKMVVAGMHVPFPGMGKVEKLGKGYNFTPLD